MKEFDAIIIGAGQAGPSLAGRLTGAGMTVGFVERKLFGGPYVNTGCTPTKTLVASAYAAHLAQRAADFGVLLDGPVSKRLASRPTRAGISRLTTGLPQRFPASGRLATATAVAPSRIPHTTTSRSSQPTFSTARNGA
jgi:pyruvate/2-oxoglutarate dehydrogenase complex dihydrolipoamide dehydrogenase (E3) component